MFLQSRASIMFYFFSIDAPPTAINTQNQKNQAVRKNFGSEEDTKIRKIHSVLPAWPPAKTWTCSKKSSKGKVAVSKAPIKTAGHVFVHYVATVYLKTIMCAIVTLMWVQLKHYLLLPGK